MSPEPATATPTATKPTATPPGLVHGPWPQDSLWGRRWPGPGHPATAGARGAIAGAALVAAVAVPLDRPGVGWLATAFAATAALIIARGYPYRPPAGAPVPLVHRPAPALTAERYAWSAATVALPGVGMLRAAGWLFLLCLATAILTGSLAVAGGRSFRAMSVATGFAVAAGIRSLPWLARGLTRPAGKPSGPKTTRIAATAGASALLLIVFGALFTSADAAFARLVRSGTPQVNGGTAARWVFVFAAAVVVVGGCAFLRAAPPDLSGWDRLGGRTVARLEWAIPLTLLVLLFAAFVAVQLTVLFGGARLVLETEGLTYAEYARGGFWQLLVVTGLTLAVLAAAVRWAPRGTRTDRLLIRSVLGALSVLTLVIVASALHRMNLYADTYGLTRLRILVALCEVWLGVMFLFVLVAGLRLRAGWLARAVIGTGVLLLLGLVVINPDGLIAERNIERYHRINRIDTTYLSRLSADAVPALDRLTGEDRDCALQPIAVGLGEHPDDWRGWNYGRTHARDLLRRNAPGDCWAR